MPLPSPSHQWSGVAGFATNSFSFSLGVMVVAGGERRRNEVENIAAVMQSNTAV